MFHLSSAVLKRGSMPKISVLSPTIRQLKALRPIEQSLMDQSFTDFEWLIEYSDGKVHELNAAFNRMLRRARGELVVIAEDYLWFPPDGLELFWNAYKSMPGYFFTAPVPKAQSYAEIKGVMMWRPPVVHEWRSQVGGEIDWRHWEIDFGAAPLQALKDLGGFDEWMDQKWGNDQTSVSYRAMKEGWKFWNLKDNYAMGLNHDLFVSHPFRHKHNPERAEKRYLEYDAGLKLEPLL